MSGSAIGQREQKPQVDFKSSGRYLFKFPISSLDIKYLVNDMLKRELNRNTFFPVPHRGLHGVRWIKHNGTSYLDTDKVKNPESFYPDVPENSIASVDAARGLYHMVELDVRVSAGIPYLLHDKTLGRTVARPYNYTKVGNKRVVNFDPSTKKPCGDDKNCVEWNLSRNNSRIGPSSLYGSPYTFYLKAEVSGKTTEQELPSLYWTLRREMSKDMKRGNLLILLDIQDEETLNATMKVMKSLIYDYLKNTSIKNDPRNFVVLKVFTNSISIKKILDISKQIPGYLPLIMPVIQSRDFVKNASNLLPISLVDELEEHHDNKKIRMIGVQASWWGAELKTTFNKKLWDDLLRSIKSKNIPLAGYHNAPNLLNNNGKDLIDKYRKGYYYNGDNGKGTFTKTIANFQKLGKLYGGVSREMIYSNSNNSWDINKFINEEFNIIISDAPGLIFADKSQVATKVKRTKYPFIRGFAKTSSTMSMNSVMNIDNSPQIDLSSVDSTSVSTTSEESVFVGEVSRPFPCSMNQLAGTATKIAANNNDIAMIDINGKVNLWDDVNKNWQDINIANQKELAIGSGTIWAINNNNRLYTIYPERDSIADMNISLKKIAVNAYGTAAGIGMDNKIYLYDEVEDEWSNLGGGASQIVVDGLGNPWHIGANNGIWRWDVDTNNWIKLTGSGKALATNGEGDVFLIGMNGKIYRWNDETENWDMSSIVQTDFVQIAALSDNLLVGMKANGSVFKSECPINYGEFQQPATMTCTRLLGNKKAFKVVTDGQQAAVIETNKDLWLYDNKTWRKLAQNAIDVAINHDGSLWYIGTDNKIYTQNTSDDTWTVVPGMAKKISIGGTDENKKVVIIGTDNAIYEFDFENNAFEKMEGTFATEIAIDSYGKIWHLGANNYVYNQTEDEEYGWRKVSNFRGTKISTSNDGVVALIGMDGNLYSYEGGITDLWKKITLNGFVANDFKEFQVSNELVILGIKNNNDLVGATKDCNTPILDNYSGDYIIQNVATGKVLDVSQASVNSGAKIIQYQDNNASNQRFKISVNATGYTISPIHAPSKYLNVCDCENSNNDPITIQSKKWDIERFNINPLRYEENGNLIASINSDFSGLDLGVHNALQSSVMQWDATWGVENDKRFQWRFIKVNSSNPTADRIAENQVNPKDSLSLETIENELIKEITEVNESSESGLVVYPNPTASEINIEVNDFADTEDLKLFFIDSMGKIILEKNIGKSRKLKLDAQELVLSNQIYIIAISNGDKKLTKKLIISNKP